MRVRPLIVFLVSCSLVCAVPVLGAGGHRVSVRGNRVTLDGRRGAVQFRAEGDLDRDGKRETVFSARLGDDWSSTLIVARKTRSGWTYLDSAESGDDTRVSITDINGDRRLEIIERGISGDGHGICSIYVLRGDRLALLWNFGQTRFRDLSGDGIPEVLSVGWISFGFVGDHWLTIYKWNGHGYTDVSARFPKAYTPVIRDIRREIYLLRYTSYHGHPLSPADAPDIFADLYYYAGVAYEYQGKLKQARANYAIAYRLRPHDDEVIAAFRKAWGLGKGKHGP